MNFKKYFSSLLLLFLCCISCNVFGALPKDASSTKGKNQSQSSGIKYNYDVIKNAINQESRTISGASCVEQGKNWLHHLVDPNGKDSRDSRMSVLVRILRDHVVIEDKFEFITSLAKDARRSTSETMGGLVDPNKKPKGTPYQLACKNDGFPAAKNLLEWYGLNYSYNETKDTVTRKEIQVNLIRRNSKSQATVNKELMEYTGTNCIPKSIFCIILIYSGFIRLLGNR